MKVAIVHYHLEPGGVTRVIENTIQAWREDNVAVETVVLSGRKYSGSILERTATVEGLDYANASDCPDPQILAERLEKAALEVLGSSPDVWHFHNHSLGKNPALTSAVSILSKKGNFILLHPHDFAEDGRPGNFRNLGSHYAGAYPIGPRIHYAALNHRDLSFLQVMLGEHSHSHLLANSIPESGEILSNESYPDLPENLYLYPVRAVRRKNLGELALLSMLFPEKHFANSLGPTNPNFQKEFDLWKSFAEKFSLNLTYGLGSKSKASFPQMVNHAEAIITTSVAEGFGLGFLEPWTFGKGLCGRNLPEITSDFANQGICLDNLYDQLEVNLDLLDDVEELSYTVAQELESFYASYQIATPPTAVAEAKEGLLGNGKVDFGKINEKFQRQILSRLASDANQRLELRDLVSLQIPNKETLSSNRIAVKQEFSQTAYGDRLYSIYQKILSADSAEITFADGKVLLNQFLSPKRLNLLRTT